MSSVARVLMEKTATPFSALASMSFITVVIVVTMVIVGFFGMV